MPFGLVFNEIPTYPEILNGTTKLSLIFAITKPQHDAEALLVTPRTLVSNLIRNANNLLPIILSWNGEVIAFLKQERKPQLFAVTY